MSQSLDLGKVEPISQEDSKNSDMEQIVSNESGCRNTFEAKDVSSEGYQQGTHEQNLLQQTHITTGESQERIDYEDDAGSTWSRSQEAMSLLRLNPQPYTTYQWTTLISFGMINLFSAMIVSLQAPFYPLEAEIKGASSVEYGFVFGVFELTVFIISPIYGTRIQEIGPKLMFNIGIVTTSLSAIGFGFIDRVQNKSSFIGISILIRTIEALGEAAFISSTFRIVAEDFPHSSMANTFAVLESFYGLGMVIGPLIGGILYQLGGYTLPFVSVGGVLLFSALCNKLLRKRRVYSVPPHRNRFQRVISFQELLSLLLIPTVAVSAFLIFSSSAGVGYLNATLEPFIRKNSLSRNPITIGAMFVISGGLYALTAPVWGFICDKMGNVGLAIIKILGSSIMFVGFSLIGPIPFIPLEPSLWGIIAGQAIQGVGLGAVLVPAFLQSLREAIKNGCPDDVHTYSLVSGIWTAMFALGGFVGPTCSGLLYDIVGFRAGSLFILGLHVISAILTILQLCCLCFPSQNIVSGEETTSLLESQQYSSTSQTNRNYKENSYENQEQDGTYYGTL